MKFRYWISKLHPEHTVITRRQFITIGQLKKIGKFITVQIQLNLVSSILV